MKARGVEYAQLTASRYAGMLRQRVRTHEPGRLVDTLLIGAIIEARSCERFAALAPVLDPELGSFYMSLLQSEARHYTEYLKLAHQVATGEEIHTRLAALLQHEKTLIETPDEEFRFHSGVPQN
jgi:tRNA-(ms[2]io[6]A)-hydroxylase